MLPGGEDFVRSLAVSSFFKEENNSLELTRTFKENLITDSEHEKKV